MLTINVEILATKWEMLERLSEMLDLRFTTFFSKTVECALQFLRRAAGQQKACCKCCAVMLPKLVAVGDDTRRAVAQSGMSD